MRFVLPVAGAHAPSRRAQAALPLLEVGKLPHDVGKDLDHRDAPSPSSRRSPWPTAPTRSAPGTPSRSSTAAGPLAHRAGHHRGPRARRSPRESATVVPSSPATPSEAPTALRTAKSALRTEPTSFQPERHPRTEPTSFSTRRTRVSRSQPGSASHGAEQSSPGPTPKAPPSPGLACAKRTALPIDATVRATRKGPTAQVAQGAPGPGRGPARYVAMDEGGSARSLMAEAKAHGEILGGFAGAALGHPDRQRLRLRRRARCSASTRARSPASRHPLRPLPPRELRAPHRQHRPAPRARLARDAAQEARPLRGQRPLGARRRARHLAHRAGALGRGRRERAHLRLPRLPALPRDLRAKLWPIVGSVVVFFLYGGALFGVLPGAIGISWQGHLFGLLGGILAARLLRTPRPPPPPAAARRRIAAGGTARVGALRGAEGEDYEAEIQGGAGAGGEGAPSRRARCARRRRRGGGAPQGHVSPFTCFRGEAPVRSCRSPRSRAGPCLTGRLGGGLMITTPLPAYGLPMVALSSQVWSGSAATCRWGPSRSRCAGSSPTLQLGGRLPARPCRPGRACSMYSSPHSRQESSKMKYCSTSGL